MQLLEQVAGVFRKRQRQRIDDFASLVRALADGQEFSPEEIADQLEAAGKSTGDLAAEIERVKQRRELAAGLVEKASLEREAADLRAKADAEAQRWQKLAEDHDAILKPLIGRGEWVGLRLGELEGNKLKLQRNYRGPLEADLQAVRDEQNQLNPKLAELRRLLTSARKAMPGPYEIDRRGPGGKEDKERVQTVIDGRQDGIDEIEAKLQKLAEQEAAILEKMTYAA
jgi:hypothetical protein